jgi:hypothetical protein
LEDICPCPSEEKMGQFEKRKRKDYGKLKVK